MIKTVMNWETVLVVLFGIAATTVSEQSDLELRISLLERKFAIQVYENTLIREELSTVKQRLLQLEVASSRMDNETIKNDCACVGNETTTFESNKLLTNTLLLALQDEKKERHKLQERIQSIETSVNSELSNLASEVRKFQIFQANMENLAIQDKLISQDTELQQLDVFISTFNQTLNSKIAAAVQTMENTHEALKESFHKNYTKLEASITQVQQSMQENVLKFDNYMANKKVAFSARLQGNVENLSPWSTLVFNHVYINEGNAYSKYSGIFTAPIRGVYAFYTHILATNRPLEMCLQKNGGSYAWLYVHGPSHGGDSNMVVLQLEPGDEIDIVKHGPYGQPPFYVHSTWTSFSGYMLYPL